jgi:hypothetical protein
MSPHQDTTSLAGNRHRWRGRLLALCIAALTLTSTVSADVLEDMEVRTQDGTGEIRLTFSVPVRYLKHFPPEHGELLKVYLQIVERSDLLNDDLRGYKRSPAMALVPSYSLTYTTARDCFATSNPLCLDFQFSQPVQYRIRPGEDGRSLIILILPDLKPTPSGTKR